MRLSTLFLAILPALPVGAQQVDPKAVAAISAASDGWDRAHTLAEDADPVATDLLTWLRLREGSGNFSDYQTFLTEKPDWPAAERLRAAGERAIPKGHDAQEVIAYFVDTPPDTGRGAVRLAEALMTSGQIKEAEDVLRTAWLELRLSERDQRLMLADFPDILRPFHTARADNLIWRSHVTEAARMLPLLDADQRALAAARIGYLRRTRNMLPLYNAVPEALREDPGLIHSRQNWLARRGDWDEAAEVLLERSTSRAALGEPEPWAGWRQVLARDAMQEGRADAAYQLASRHYLTGGADYADLEWLSGYLALTYLGDPSQALDHFENAARVVRTPISSGRMHYWVGRAHEATGNPDQANAAYGAAAEYQTSFYGLLAAEKLGLPLDPAFAGAPVEWRGAPIFDHDVVKSAFILLDAGQRSHAVTFFSRLGEILTPAELAQIGAALDAMDEQYYTLRMGKQAASSNTLAPSVYYPLHDLALLEVPVDSALALSIARRESEFNIGIGSPAGALGLMQLMPGTAKEVAGFLGLSYSRARLTTDWAYNAQLGTKYLSILEQEFGPTPVLIAAGYNAGPSRPNIWMDERGDPRLGEMDVVDWIEHIPFSETRNYVMRVAESIPVYQARLSGETGPIRFTEMLIGRKPLLRPRARPLPQVVEDIPTLRPLSRPEPG
ncbi:lytic transglycosylase domain-containing protein [Loktanella agnita]|uniref:lytic transglycosylase domain-containing protein n=1 Tax=Loktanella agnita TaxID=287097 RepID=UPI0039862DAF